MRSNSKTPRFAICLKAKPEDDLQVGKVYRILRHAKAAGVGCLRVIDESGEDYLYAASQFIVVNIPEKARGQLLRAVGVEASLTKR